jgi:hypothetical protein
VVSAAGTRNTTVRLEPLPLTAPAAVVTGDPLPEGGVMVTVTLEAEIVPDGNPVPTTLTDVPG